MIEETNWAGRSCTILHTRVASYLTLSATHQLPCTAHFGRSVGLSCVPVTSVLPSILAIQGRSTCQHVTHIHTTLHQRLRSNTNSNRETNTICERHHSTVHMHQWVVCPSVKRMSTQSIAHTTHQHNFSILESNKPPPLKPWTSS